MNDSNPLPNPEVPPTIGEERRHSHSGRWLPGLILIVLGAIFLLNNLTGFELHNWWALFILIPAVGSFGRAWSQYNRTGSLDRYGRQAVLSGLMLAALAAVFLFELSWMLFGPVLLILVGLTILGNEFLP
jgi:hypothetical protein